MSSRHRPTGVQDSSSSGPARVGSALTVLILAPLCLGLSAIACDPSATGGSSVAPGAGPPDVARPDQPVGRDEGDSAAALKARFKRQHSELSSATTDSGLECRDLCELSAAICETKAKLCKIADNQSSVTDYRNLCLRATRSCHEAKASCLTCTQRFERNAPEAMSSEPSSASSSESSVEDPVSDPE